MLEVFAHYLLYIQNIFKVNFIDFHLIKPFNITLIRLSLKHFEDVVKRLARYSNFINSWCLILLLLLEFSPFFFEDGFYFEVDYILDNCFKRINLLLSLTPYIIQAIDSNKKTIELFLYLRALFGDFRLECDLTGLL